MHGPVRSSSPGKDSHMGGVPPLRCRGAFDIKDMLWTVHNRRELLLFSKGRWGRSCASNGCVKLQAIFFHGERLMKISSISPSTVLTVFQKVAPVICGPRIEVNAAASLC